MKTIFCDWQIFWYENSLEPQFRNFTSVENLIVKSPDGRTACQIFDASASIWVDKDAITAGDIICSIKEKL